MIRRVQAILAALGGLLAAIAAAWLAGRRAGKEARQVDNLRAYKDTRERADDAAGGIDGVDAARERLRDIAGR